MFLRVRLSVLLASSMGLCLCGATGCNARKPRESKASPQRVRGIHPYAGEIAPGISGNGILAPNAQAEVMSRVSEPIQKIYVTQGAHVRAGQLIAVLASADLEAAAVESRGAYAAAKGAYDTATGSTIPEEQHRAELEMSDAKQKLQIANDTLENVQAMFSRGVSSGHTLALARTAAQNERSAFAAASDHYQIALHAGNSAAIETAKGQLEAARGHELAAETQLEATRLRSPIDGVVAALPVVVGQTVGSGVSIATIADTASLLVKLHLPQEKTHQLSAGLKAQLKVRGFADPIEATVSLVSPMLDAGSTTVEVWIHLKNSNAMLKAGIPVHAEIDAPVVRAATLIPTSAIQRSRNGNEQIVFVLGADGIARSRTVTLGVQNAGVSQVIEGLSASDTVITDGVYGLEDGTPVSLDTSVPEKP